MPDATHGVPVWLRTEDPVGPACVQLFPFDESKPGTWYPADEAAALENVADARCCSDCLRKALDRLDEIRNDKEKER